MKTHVKLAAARQFGEVELVSTLSSAELRHIQRLAKSGDYVRLHKGVYVVNAGSEGIQAVVRKNWQKIAGTIVPGGVVSHASGMTSGVQGDNSITLSHPTQFGKPVELPGLTLVLLRGAGPLPGDFPLGQTGLYWSGRTRQLLENLGRASKNKAGPTAVEERLVSILGASGEKALNDIRDEAAGLAPLMGLLDNEEVLRSLIGALLGTYTKGHLKTRDGQMMAQGTPVDNERMARFELLAAYLRSAVLPTIADKVQAGKARHNAAFIESYFSNYVEGTKFDIDEAREIVLNNKIVASRPADSHDVVGVFRLATTSPFRDSPPTMGSEFLTRLEVWHEDMLRMRPEAKPGQTKLEMNYAGNTAFVVPSMVRGTLEAGSELAKSVPEGLARAIYYAFLVSEVHPFEDGNGRLSRLVMNAELSRFGLQRIIIPTLYHPQYVDCARSLTRNNSPENFVRSLAKMAVWSSQFDYRDLEALIAALKATNAMEESLVQYKLKNLDGSVI